MKRIKEDLYFYENSSTDCRFIVLYKRENLSQKKPIGMALFFEDKKIKSIILLDMVTRADVRGKGEELIKYILNNSKLNKIKIFPYVDAIKAYKKLGFELMENKHSSNIIILNATTSNM